PSNAVRWHTSLSDHMGRNSASPKAYDWFGPLFRCPANKSHERYLAVGTSTAFGSYGYSDRGTTLPLDVLPAFGLGGAPYILNPTPLPESAVVKPADMFALGDGTFTG